MTMSAAHRQTVLSSWIKPSSDDEQTQQDRAERMIADAIRAHPAFAEVSIRVYAKGSYANNTNVRRDSDVDIVVENRDCSYYEYFQCEVPATGLTPYSGIWTPAVWRREVTAAIVNKFGSSDVDSDGSVALVVAAKARSRPSADVVPSFLFYRYDTSDRRVQHRGSRAFKATGGVVQNWPQQQLDNGREKNRLTGGRYKNYVRALKNAENVLVTAKVIDPVPSYLMECLVYNVPNRTLATGTLDEGFRATLLWLMLHLTKQYVREHWEEPNRLKYLFHDTQKWTVGDAVRIVLHTWQFLDYS